jgi:hypothetical protein
MHSRSSPMKIAQQQKIIELINALNAPYEVKYLEYNHVVKHIQCAK